MSYLDCYKSVYPKFSSKLLFHIAICSEGSVGVDYVATFNDTTGVNNEMIQRELVGVLNATKNGTFIGDSDLKISDKTDLNEVANELTFQGKSDMQ